MTEGTTIAGQDGRFDHGLRDIRIPADVLPMPADDAMNQARLLVGNPRSLTRADALSVYEQAG